MSISTTRADDECALGIVVSPRSTTKTSTDSNDAFESSGVRGRMQEQMNRGPEAVGQGKDWRILDEAGKH